MWISVVYNYRRPGIYNKHTCSWFIDSTVSVTDTYTSYSAEINHNRAALMQIEVSW